MPQRRRAIRSIILILIACLLVYLFGNGSVSLWDRDEPRYAQTSRQMLQSGDWVVPRLLDQIRTAKPIFIYWCQAGAMKLLGDTAFAARLPSVIGMTLTLILLAVVIYRTIGPRRAMWTVLIMGTAGLSIAAAKMCLTDAVLLFFITTAQLCLCAMYVAPARTGRGLAIIMWIAIALAGLTKGPVVIGVQLTTMLVLAIADRKTAGIGWWKKTCPIMGILIVGIICAPWLLLVHHRAPSFLNTIIGHDVIERATSGLEGHKGPPGYYLLTVWGTFLPWSLLLPSAMLSAWQNRRLPQIRFALAAIVGPWVMFEIVQTKLPHYVLPTFPAIAILTADMLIRIGRSARRWRFSKRQCGPSGPGPLADRLFLAAVLVWGGAFIVISLLPWLALIPFQSPPWPAWFAMILLPILALEYARGVYVHFRAARPLDSAAIMGAGMLILIALLYGLYLPNATYLQISPQVAQILRHEGATQPGQAIMIDYKETSLAFYQGGTIRPQDDDRFLEHVSPVEWPRCIVLTRRIWNETPPEIQSEFDVLRTEHGVNYADHLRVMDVMVLRRH